LYKKLKFRFLPNPTFFLTLILFIGKPACAQFGPVGVKTKFQHVDSVFQLSLQTTFVPDSTRLKLLKVKCVFQASGQKLYWAVSNSGAILAFSDSLLQKPLFLEKRNVYPFLHLRSRSKYWFEITRSNGKDGYLAARLLDDLKEVVIDEVFLCLLSTDQQIMTIEVFPEGWIK
jgi:hypothetical protein